MAPLELGSWAAGHGCWDLNSDPLEEQWVLLTAETSPECLFFFEEQSCYHNGSSSFTIPAKMHKKPCF